MFIRNKECISLHYKTKKKLLGDSIVEKQLEEGDSKASLG